MSLLLRIFFKKKYLKTMYGLSPVCVITQLQKDKKRVGRFWGVTNIAVWRRHCIWG